MPRPKVRPWGEIYDEPTTLRSMVRWVATHETFVTDLARCSKVIEIGTGTATLSAFLSHLCDLSVSVDNSDGVLRSAREFLSSIRARVPLVKTDAFRLPFADQSFDAAYSQGLFEHFSDEDARRLAEEQVRVARWAYVSVPSIFYPHLGHRGPGLIGNERLLTLRRWRRMLDGLVVDGRYYPDFKVASIGGWTVPWPNHALLRLSRDASAIPRQAGPATSPPPVL